MGEKLITKLLMVVVMCPLFNIRVHNLLFLIILQKPESPPPPPPEEELIEDDIYDEGISFKVNAIPMVNKCLHVDSSMA